MEKDFARVLDTLNTPKVYREVDLGDFKFGTGTYPAFRYVKNTPEGLAFKSRFEAKLFETYGNPRGLSQEDSIDLTDFVWENFSTLHDMEEKYDIFSDFLVKRDAKRGLN